MSGVEALVGGLGVSFVLTAGIIAGLARTPRANHSKSWERSKQLKDQGADWLSAATAGFDVPHVSGDTE